MRLSLQPFRNLVKYSERERGRESEKEREIERERERGREGKVKKGGREGENV